MEDPRLSQLLSLDYSGITHDHVRYSTLMAKCSEKDRMIIEFFRKYRAYIISDHIDWRDVEIFVKGVTEESDGGKHIVTCPEVKRSLEELEKEFNFDMYIIRDRYGVTLSFSTLSEPCGNIISLLDSEPRTSLRYYSNGKPEIPYSFSVHPRSKNSTDSEGLQKILRSDPNTFTYLLLQSSVRTQLKRAMVSGECSCMGFDLIPELYQAIEGKPFTVDTVHNRLTVGDYSLLDMFIPYDDVVSVRGEHTITIDRKFMHTLYALYLIFSDISLM
uniref:Uncharacterized protein n=1 Tax=viral metagenome TaxID=1070528 RepID=A0A6C0BMS1_9ZZZZ